jgi:Zn-dependent protease
MLRAWKIGRFLGIDLYLHWSFLLLLFFVILEQRNNGDLAVPLTLAVFTIFGSVILHEYGHALAARQFGINTRDITLYVIGGVARLERISENPWEEFWIALAGPAVNVVIAMLLGMLLAVLSVWDPRLIWIAANENMPLTALGVYLVATIVGNLFLVAFNMVPVFPMDGGRVFRSILSLWLGHLQATRIAATVGAAVAIVGGAALAFTLQSPMVLLVAFFVIFAGQQELRYVEWRFSRGGDDEEPLPVIPVQQPPWAIQAAQTEVRRSEAITPRNGLMFQPRVSVFIWDSAANKWVQEAGPSHAPPRLSES